MKDSNLWLIVCLVVVGAYWLIPYAIARADAAEQLQVPSRYFAETGHNIGGQFLAFYTAHNGEVIFGKPITEIHQEQGLEVQYFEHVRLEKDKRYPNRVLVSTLGEMLARERSNESPFKHHPAAPAEVSTYFSSTGHNLSYAFRQFWEEYGAHPIFGSPVSEAFLTYDEDGVAYTVQYFERVRLEYRLKHPGGQATVQVGALGHEYAQQYVDQALLEPARPIEILGESTITFAPLPGDMQNISLAARQFDGLKIAPGEHVSYLETVGELSTETGYVAGSGIVNGGTGEVLAGGICYLSTALFQAVLQAGLAVQERHSHTVLLPDLSDTPGMDSAVYTSDGKGLNRNGLYDLDLRWSNDMPDPLIITTKVITNGTLKVQLWGYHDGRKSKLHEPIIDQLSGPGSIWRSDASLPPCTVKQIIRGVPGMSTTIEREVLDAKGDILHQDQFFSFYSPFKDVFIYGPGITPIYDGRETPDVAAREACTQARR
jgi:hypothetical protein